MPNIFITNTCNLQCQYCFAANTYDIQKQEFLTLSQLDNILNWLQLIEYKAPIQILGGEPTLHPQFREIINKIDTCYNYDSQLMPCVFSNGIFLKDYIDLFYINHLLININEPYILKNSYNIILKNLEQFYNNKVINNCVGIGINLFPKLKDFNYIFDIAKEYGFNKIRCSYASPVEMNLNMNKFEYYQQGKKIFMDFIETAHKYKTKVQIGVDCNHIPICMFSNDEIDLLEQTCWNFYQSVNQFSCWPPSLDIKSDLTGTACMGIKNFIDLTQFHTKKELQEYFLQQFLEIIKNNDEKCLNCQYFKNQKCQGGCLSFMVKK